MKRKLAARKWILTALALDLAAAPAASVLPAQAKELQLSSDAGPFLQTADTTGWQGAYLQTIRNLAQNSGDDPSEEYYSLIDIDGDATPEMVVTMGVQPFFKVYTFHNGSVADLLEDNYGIESIHMVPGADLILYESYQPGGFDSQGMVSVSKEEDHRLDTHTEPITDTTVCYYDSEEIPESVYNQVKSQWDSYLPAAVSADDLPYYSIPALLAGAPAYTSVSIAADGTGTITKDGVYYLSNAPFDAATGAGMAYSFEKSRLIVTTGDLMRGGDAYEEEPLATYVIPLSSRIKYGVVDETQGTDDLTPLIYMNQKKFKKYLKKQDGSSLKLTVKNGKLTEIAMYF